MKDYFFFKVAVFHEYYERKSITDKLKGRLRKSSIKVCDYKLPVTTFVASRLSRKPNNEQTTLFKVAS